MLLFSFFCPVPKPLELECLTRTYFECRINSLKHKGAGTALSLSKQQNKTPYRKIITFFLKRNIDIGTTGGSRDRPRATHRNLR